MRAPWEDTVGAPDPGASRRLAAALTRWLAPWRWRVAPWPGGYTVAGPQGALAPAGSVDEVVARARAARPEALRGLLGDAPPAEDLELAEAVVRVSVAALHRLDGTISPFGGLPSMLRLPGGPLILAGPDPGGARRLVAHGHVPVDVVPRPGTGWSVG